jgi:hypothetical protein
MPDLPVSGFTAATAVLDTDLFYMARSPYGAGDDRKITGANVKASTGQITRAASGSPEGVVTANGPAIYYTLAGGFWVFGGTYGTNTGWIALINEP